MASSHRRLIIVVDGTTELSPYWSKILSECIQKIIRLFYDKSRKQEANNAICELGLVMYNANSQLGFDLQSINWTRDVDTFLGTLSCLAFNGDNLSQYAMAEGLAEALMMHTKPFNGSCSTQDYYDGEKHCILVAAGNPVPLKMLVTVPMVRDGKLVLGRLQQNIEADFLEVTQLFSQLAVSLSVITPNQHAIFGEIFNLGNNITEMAYTGLCNYKVDQCFVMLSRNFKEAREAIHEKRVEDSSGINNLQSMRTSNITHSEIFNTDFQVNVYEDVMAEMDAIHDNVLLCEKSNTTSLEFAENPLSNLFMQSQPTFDDVQYSLGQEQTNPTIKMVSLDALKTVEAELGKTLEGSSSSPQDASRNENYLIDLTKDDEEEHIQPEALPEVSSAAITTTITTTISSGIRSPNGLLVDEPRGDPWVLDFNLVNNPSSDFLTHQNSSSLWPTTQPSWNRGLEYGNVSTPIRSGNYGQTEPENQAENGFGNYLLQHSTQNSVMNEFQAFTSPRVNNVYHEVSSTEVGGVSMVPFSSQYPLHDVQGIGTNTTTSWVPTMSGIPQLTQWEPLLPPPSSVMDFSDYVQAWEGYLCGSTKSDNMFFNSAKGFKKATSSLMFTQWLGRLDITYYMPQRAINHTQSIYHYNVEYILFQIIEYTNRDLYNYLIGANMCAKIDLPSQTLILSPTENEFLYVGIVFPQAVIFVEQKDLQNENTGCRSRK